MTWRKVAGFKVQYFAAVEEQLRMAAHLHSAIRGAIPRRIIRDTAKAVYYSAWWPPIDQVVYDTQVPRWDGTDYVDPNTGVVLPTWEEALDEVQFRPTRTRHRCMWCGSVRRPTLPGSLRRLRMRTARSGT